MLSPLEAADHAIFDWINAAHVPWLDTVMLAASHVGMGGSVWLVVAAILFVFPSRRAGAWRLILTIGLAALVVDGIMKPLIWRDRPYVVLAHARVIDAQPTTSSLPSGHAALAVAGAAAASHVLPAARIAWWTLALVTVVSRIYVGVHFPSDALAGALVGLLCARLTLGDVKKQHASFEMRPTTGT